MPMSIWGNSAKIATPAIRTQGFGGAAVKFDHQAASVFPLQGKHAVIACAKCHVKTTDDLPGRPGRSGAATSRWPRDCLRLPRRLSPGTAARDCRQCHGLDSFKPAPGFDHERSRFSLKLFHEGVGCRECHPLYRPRRHRPAARPCRRPATRISAAHAGSATAISITAGPAFALTGVHGGLDCGACHNARTPNIRKKGSEPRPMECTWCHKSPHLGQQKNCRECHNGKDWRVEPW